MLPAEATWVNTVLARLMYDVMRDPQMIARVQNKIQRKLNTLKNFHPPIGSQSSFSKSVDRGELSFLARTHLPHQLKSSLWPAVPMQI
ncbi:jg6896 [Pararge aegeria aegeria]|uniref:Jg6896 protein n=1 Tax=Pararge aegeria aegeria TaxID=348720 RepID=A0A8S4QL82_9NEOP|nr:jg6896 [Pararge aegeria aegeria]